MHMQTPRGLEETGIVTLTQHAGIQRLRLALLPSKLFLKTGFRCLSTCSWCHLPWLLFLLREINVRRPHSFLHGGRSARSCSTFPRAPFSFEMWARGWPVAQDEELAGTQRRAAAECPRSTRVAGAARNAARGKRGKMRDVDSNIPGTSLNSTIPSKSNIMIQLSLPPSDPFRVTYPGYFQSGPSRPSQASTAGAIP